MDNTNELIMNFRKQAASMSFYNAAEGDWRSETDARNECRKKLIEAADKLREVGIDPSQYESQFLISSGDYTDYSLKARL